MEEFTFIESTAVRFKAPQKNHRSRASSETRGLVHRSRSGKNQNEGLKDEFP